MKDHHEKKQYISSIFPFTTLPDYDFQNLTDNRENIRAEMRGLKKQLEKEKENTFELADAISRDKDETISKQSAQLESLTQQLEAEREQLSLQNRESDSNIADLKSTEKNLRELNKNLLRDISDARVGTTALKEENMYLINRISALAKDRGDLFVDLQEVKQELNKKQEFFFRREDSFHKISDSFEEELDTLKKKLSKKCKCINYGAAQPSRNSKKMQKFLKQNTNQSSGSYPI